MENELSVEEFKFQEIKLEEVQRALQENLGEYFGHVNVEIVDCPDLSEPPFNLASNGFGGGETGIIDLGGVPYLFPSFDRTKVYDLAKIASEYVGTRTDGYPDGFYISGCAAGPWPSQESNSEMVVSMLINKEGKMLNNKSKVALIAKDTKDASKRIVALRELEKEESRCALLANLMVSTGSPGKVIRVEVAKRTDMKAQLTGSIRNSLLKQFGNTPIGLGGCFLVQNAKTKVHVMPDFSENPLKTDEEIKNWFKMFEMDPPMLFQSVILSKDPGLDVRVEHSHGWSLCKSEGGHYHYDLAGDTVQYVGYYALVQKLWRIDRPKESHLIGRD